MTGPQGWRVLYDDLAPFARRGSVIVVEPGEQCSEGDRVLITMADRRTLVREFVGRTDEAITVGDVVTGAREVLQRAAVADMHPITQVVAASKWKGADSPQPAA